ncbi:MAG: modification methylase [Ignavibacteriales bacterium CG_4_9_14_3_um_filter_30_11]|nr:MAG: modification methylase [Ignavibacteriales bacterium CG_4_9_14_3_um_filter_30_11]
MTIKSPLRYPGGKSKAIKVISKIIPDFTEFREPFVGGGSVFVYLKQKYPSRDFWINDIYSNLYHFWNECKENPVSLINSILKFRSEFPDGKELHRFLLENIESFDNIKKAAAFFIFNRITFSGTTESGGFSNAAFHKRFTDSSIERVKSLSNILNNTRISNLDYEELINADGENVFLFLDPPYFSATKSALYGKNGTLHKIFDHERFAYTIKKSKHKWLITYDDSEYIRNLFSFAHIKAWDLTYGMRNVNKDSNQIGKELFISNYSLDDIKVKQIDLFSYPNVNKNIAYT